MYDKVNKGTLDNSFDLSIKNIKFKMNMLTWTKNLNYLKLEDISDNLLNYLIKQEPLNVLEKKLKRVITGENGNVILVNNFHVSDVKELLLYINILCKLPTTSEVDRIRHIHFVCELLIQNSKLAPLNLIEYLLKKLDVNKFEKLIEKLRQIRLSKIKSKNN
jgi:hypothetical protein